jgi:hypothetical protein
LGVYFEVLFHTLFSWLGLPVLGLIVAIFRVSRAGWGTRAGVAMLCAVGYLHYLALLYALGATQGPDSMGYGWLPLLAFTLPWSFLFDPIAGQGLHVGGVAGMVLDFALLVGVYGGHELAALPWRRLDCRSLYVSPSLRGSTRRSGIKITGSCREWAFWKLHLLTRRLSGKLPQRRPCRHYANKSPRWSG